VWGSACFGRRVQKVRGSPAALADACGSGARRVHVHPPAFAKASAGKERAQ